MVLILDELECKAGILETLFITKTILSIITIIVPIILIIICMINITAIMTSDDPSSKKIIKKIGPKFLSATFVFLLPSIINMTMDVIEGINLSENNCWKEATRENVRLKKDAELNALSLLEKNRTEAFNKSLTDEIKKAKAKKIKYTEKEKTNTSDDSTNTSDTPITGTFDIKDKDHLVGIMYTTWFDAILPSNPVLTTSSSCTANNYCFWGEPALGYYKSSDTKVIEKHMTQLSDAGVDFIILDNTNLNATNRQYWNDYVTKPMTAILNTIIKMRKAGKQTPYVLNWIWTGNNASGGRVPFESWESVNKMYDKFYTKEKYKDAWVYWDKKPFILTTSTPTSNPSKKITTRSMWGLNGVSSVNWTYLEHNNDKSTKGNEQIGVSTAMQADYMSNTSTAKCRRGGKTFKEQWQVAFNRKPKIVTITWWNEWGALKLNGHFTDLYNQECSRDIEPMKGGHGDTYYQWMKKYINAYKNDKNCPTNLVSS